MKRTFKLISLILVLAIAATCAFAEGTPSISGIIDAAEKLAFRTSNATINVKADFSFDGEVFKKMDASYKQDGYDSYLRYMLDTVKDGETVYTGGYTVVGIGSDVYANDTYNGNYYTQLHQGASDTILENTVTNEAAFSLLRSVGSFAAGLFTENSVTETESGKAYHISSGALPEVIGSTLYYFGLDYLKDNYYMYMYSYSDPEGGPYIRYEDWDKMINEKHQLIYGEDVPEDLSDDIAYDRYMVAYNVMEQEEKEIIAKVPQEYANGYVYVHADGTTEYLATEEDYMRKAGELYTSYADYTSALCAYYEKVYGKPLEKDYLEKVLYWSNNPDLNDKLYDLSTEMDEYYEKEARAQDPNAVLVKVKTDGSFTALDTFPFDYYYLTMTRAIFDRMKSVTVSSAEADITTDAEGLLTGAKGTVTFAMTDETGKEHTIGISFDCTVSDYGSTEVEDWFDPAKYGFVSYDEWAEAKENEPLDGDEYDEEYWEKFYASLPETAEFGGETYQLIIPYEEAEG